MPDRVVPFLHCGSDSGPLVDATQFREACAAGAVWLDLVANEPGAAAWRTSDLQSILTDVLGIGTQDVAALFEDRVLAGELRRSPGAPRARMQPSHRLHVRSGYRHAILYAYEASCAPDGCLNFDAAGLHEVDLIFGTNWLVTYSDRAIHPIAETRTDAAARKALREGSALAVAAIIMRRVVESTAYEAAFLEDDAVALLHRSAAKRPRNAVLHEIMMKRRLLGHLRQVAYGQRHAIRRAGLDDALLHEIEDAAETAVARSDCTRETLTSAQEIYLAAVSNRMNRTMEVLTWVTVAALPLTLAIGVYGTNGFPQMALVGLAIGCFVPSVPLGLLVRNRVVVN